MANNVKFQDLTSSDLEKHFTSLITALQDQFQQLKVAKQELASKEAALAREKEQMTNEKIGQDDVIELNVGGEIMATTRSTLCQVEGSLLASMFSGRWEDKLCKDKQGNYFLDFEPAFFKPILSYLRAKKIETPERKTKAPTAPISQDDDNFWDLVCSLGLNEEFKPKVESEVMPLLLPGGTFYHVNQYNNRW